MPNSAEILDNPKSQRIKHIIDLHTAKGRRKVGKTLLEAPQAVREALMVMPERITDLYYCVQSANDHAIVRIEECIALAKQQHVYIHEVSARVMDAMSSDAQGVVAILDTSQLVVTLEDLATQQNQVTTVRSERNNTSQQQYIAACWQVRDPGNAGTLLRSAAAAGCSAIVLVDECVDAMSPKVLRASVGAFAHIRIAQASLDELFAYCSRQSIQLYAADVYGTALHPPIDMSEVLRALMCGSDDMQMLRGDLAILFGNEARGLSDDVIDRCDGTLTLPMYGNTESMNLATSASIMLHTLAMARHA